MKYKSEMKNFALLDLDSAMILILGPRYHPYLRDLSGWNLQS